MEYLLISSVYIFSKETFSSKINMRKKKETITKITRSKPKYSNNNILSTIHIRSFHKLNVNIFVFQKTVEFI